MTVPLTTDYIARPDTSQAVSQRDLAAEARHGGRYITGALAKMAEHHPEAFASLRAGEYPEAWRYHLSPSGGTGSGRDTTAASAQRRAAGNGYDWRPPSIRAAEAMFDWPIYRAAMLRPVATAWEAARIAYAPESSEPSTTLCQCGHTFGQHQTGEGPWTGFCGGTLGQLGPDYIREGDDPNEPCACERPVVAD